MLDLCYTKTRPVAIYGGAPETQIDVKNEEIDDFEREVASLRRPLTFPLGRPRGIGLVFYYLFYLLTLSILLYIDYYLLYTYLVHII